MESRTEMHAWTSGRAAGGWGAVAAIAAGLLMMACGGPRAVTEPDPAAQYRAAIADARTAEPSEIATTLTPLVPYNDALVWRAPADSTRQVLVVTWGGADTLPPPSNSSATPPTAPTMPSGSASRSASACRPTRPTTASWSSGSAPETSCAPARIRK
jgi:hypothetical protein